MEAPINQSERQLEVLKGFKEGGIGIHGTFTGNLSTIREKGILLPTERGMSNVQDNIVAYYSTPSRLLIDRTIQMVGREYAAEVLWTAIERSLKNNFGYAQSEGFYREKRLDWVKWKDTPELLPAVVFFKDAGEISPPEYPLPTAARGTYTSLTIPEMRSSQSIEATRILGSVEITLEDVETMEASHSELNHTLLRKSCEKLLIQRAFHYLLQAK